MTETPFTKATRTKRKSGGPYHDTGMQNVEVWRKQLVLESPSDNPSDILSLIGDQYMGGDPANMVTDEVEFETRGHVFTLNVRPSEDTIRRYNDGQPV